SASGTAAADDRSAALQKYPRSVAVRSRALHLCAARDVHRSHHGRLLLWAHSLVTESPVRFVVQRITGGGVTLNQVRGNVLRIGRGTNVHLRSDSPAVALEHAAIEATDDSYVISDSGSVTGTYVNGRAIERAPLVKG